MKKLNTLLFSLCLTSIMGSAAAQTWKNTFTSDGTGERPQMKESPDGTVYMAFRDYQTGKANVKQYSNKTWTWVGDSVFSPGIISQIRLAVGADNKPVVAFQDVGSNFQLTVMKYNGTTWDTIGNRGFSGLTSAGDIGLAIKGNTIFAAYQQYNQIKVWYWDAFQGQWSFVGNNGLASTGFPSGLDLEVIDNNLYVAYRENSGKSMVRFTGATNPSAGNLWSTLGAAYNSGVSSCPKIIPVLGRVMTTNKKSSDNKFTCDMYIPQGSLWYKGGTTPEQILNYSYDVSSNNIDSTAYLAYIDPSDSGRIYSANINLSWSKLGNGLFTDEGITGEVATLYTSDRQLFVAYQTRTGSKIKVNTFCSTVSNATLTLAGDTVFCGDTNVLLTASTKGRTYQWYKDGVMLSAETSKNLTVSESGSYKYIVSNSCGDIDSSGAIVLTKEPVPAPTVTINGSTLETQSFGLYQWRKSGVNIPGATSQTYTPTEDGQYSVAVTNTRVLCPGESPEVSFTMPIEPSGVASIEGSSNLSVYPNPTEGIIWISGVNKIDEFSLVNITGSSIELEVSQNDPIQINLNNHPKGVYFLYLKDSEGMDSVQKIILK
ncbi:MAG: T9SS type A sorting domain-containing protein [Flavobacteriales bacterium]|nr:T9SS type A sorting domain-containing protein [Flavobacteriales bacterium]